MAYTKSQLQQITRQTPLTGYVIGTPSAIVATDQLIIALGKLEATTSQHSTQIGTIQTGNNLFMYYNFY